MQSVLLSHTSFLPELGEILQTQNGSDFDSEASISNADVEEENEEEDERY